MLTFLKNGRFSIIRGCFRSQREPRTGRKWVLMCEMLLQMYQCGRKCLNVGAFVVSLICECTRLMLMINADAHVEFYRQVHVINVDVLEQRRVRFADVLFVLAPGQCNTGECAKCWIQILQRCQISTLSWLGTRTSQPLAGTDTGHVQDGQNTSTISPSVNIQKHSGNEQEQTSPERGCTKRLNLPGKRSGKNVFNVDVDGKCTRIY